MKTRIFFMFFILIHIQGYSQTPAIDTHWNLIWEDNFTTLSKIQTEDGTWKIGTAWGVFQNGAHDASSPTAYSKDNITLSSSSGLIISTKKEECSWGFAFSSNGTNFTFLNGGLGVHLTINTIISHGIYKFVGTSDNGVYRSTYNENTWNTVNNGLTNLAINNLFPYGNSIYACTKGGGIFRSDDNGDTWIAINNGLTNLYVNSLLIYNNFIFACTNEGLFSTSINSINWICKKSNVQVFSIINVGTNILIGTSWYGVYLSTDFGDSWSPKNIGLQGVNYFNNFIIKDNFLFVGTGINGVFRSDLTGNSWSAVNTGLSNLNIKSFAVIGNNLYAGTYGSGLYVSTNNGNSWSNVSADLSNKNINALAVDGTEIYVGIPGKYYSPFHYTSGGIGSWGNENHYPKYGYIEAKIKMNDTYGTWPSFWLWDADDTDYDEIDIFEMVPGVKNTCSLSLYNNQVYNKNLMTSNIHTDSNEKGCTNLWNDRGEVNYINDYTIPHKYAIEWTPSKIIFYIDGQIIRNSINPGFDVFTNTGGMISRPLCIILGSGLTNYTRHSESPPSYYNNNSPTYYDYYNPPASYLPQTSINNSTATMEVEYVKYYKLDMLDCGTDVTYIDRTQLVSYNKKVKKNILIDGINNISLGGGRIYPDILRASESILINKNFEVPVGYELYLDVNPCY